MEYKKIEFNNFNLHLTKTDKFKTNVIDFVFRKVATNEDFTYRKLLSNIFRNGSAEYSNRQEIELKKIDLYNASFSQTSILAGNYIVSDFCVTCINDKYSELNLFENVLDFANEIIFNPKVANKAFDKELFNIAYTKTIEEIKISNENKGHYALERMFKKTALDFKLSLDVEGDLEILESITPESLYDYYLEMMNNDLVDIYVNGDIDFHLFESVISKNFMFINSKKHTVNVVADVESNRKIAKKIIEKDDINQSRLVMGLIANNISDYERMYILPVYQVILGGSSVSKLFINIREKNSLCYFIHTNNYRFTNFLSIEAGIKSENFDKTTKLIKAEIKNMESGKITSEEFEAAQAYLVDQIDNKIDSQSYLNYMNYWNEFITFDGFEHQKKVFKEIKLSDIMTFSKKVAINTIYLLEGE